MEQKIRSLRQRLDAILKLMKALQPFNDYGKTTREISLAITANQKAFMWLGQTLKALGAPNPYPDSKKPENEKIAPLSDAAGEDISLLAEAVYVDYTHTQMVKAIRVAIDGPIEEIWDLFWSN